MASAHVFGNQVDGSIQPGRSIQPAELQPTVVAAAAPLHVLIKLDESEDADPMASAHVFGNQVDGSIQPGRSIQPAELQPTVVAAAAPLHVLIKLDESEDA